jgi:dTDP-4-amino-4,6-dideoxygalactose transaminase
MQESNDNHQGQVHGLFPTPLIKFPLQINETEKAVLMSLEMTAATGDQEIYNHLFSRDTYILNLPQLTPLRDKVEKTLNENGIEFRRGLSGGGNQIRQPYFKKNYNFNYDDFKNVDHVHHFGWYIGNYPTLEQEKIDKLLDVLNNDIS